MTQIPTRKNLLFTGPPGCGKSTLIEKIVRKVDRPCAGFFTREIRDRGRRAGFAVHTLDGKRGIPAHVDSSSRIKVGKYAVNLQDVDHIAVPSLIPENDRILVVVDEIGKMECFSPRFRQTLLQVLDSPNPVLGSVALKGDAFIQGVKKRADTEVVLVSEQNRDALAEVYFRNVGEDG